jgi:hypothetical protein
LKPISHRRNSARETIQNMTLSLTLKAFIGLAIRLTWHDLIAALS